MKLAEARHAHAAEERNSAAARLGRQDDQVVARPAGNAGFEEPGRALDRITADRIGDALDQRDAARDRAINGVAEG